MRVRNFTRWASCALALALLVVGGFVLAPSRALADTSVSTWGGLRTAIENTPTATPTVITLADDIEASPDDTKIDVVRNKEITIDLNGHTISRNLEEAVKDGYVLMTKGTLTLTGSGSVTGGKSTNTAGGIDVQKFGTVELRDEVKVTGNAGSTAGGVACVPGYNVRIGDAAEVYGNTDLEGNTVDIYLARGSTDGNALIEVVSTLTGENTMYVTNQGFPESTAILTTGYAQHNGNDAYADTRFDLAKKPTGYEIAFSESPWHELISHKHNWRFTENGNVLEARCNVSLYSCDCHSEPATLVIDASACTKKADGKPAAAATVTPSDSWLAYRLDVPTPMYTGAGSTKYPASATPPTVIGTYRAFVTVVTKGKTSVVGENFEILPGTVTMYRLYNPNSGEHFYTKEKRERDALRAVGWNYEGIGWKAPESSRTPVYRLYNENAGDHHYTPSIQERNALLAAGWNYEGIGWYSDDDKGVPLYRQYNPNAVTGTHNYTTDSVEAGVLVRIGWRDEGIGWYGVV